MRKNTRRRPWLAAFLSLLLPGLGQFYCGATLRSLWLLALTSPSAIFALLSLYLGVRINGSLVLWVYVLSLPVTVFGIVDAFFTARRTREDYELKDYNRWYAYVLLYVTVSAGHIFSALYIRDNQLMPFRIPTLSMYPTIWPNDALFVVRDAYMTKDPAVGDIVAFHNPDDRSVFYLKRVVAVGGDTVELRNGDLYVNGIKVRKEEAPVPVNPPTGIIAGGGYFYEFNRRAKYRILASARGDFRQRNFPPTVVPKHECFLLGDNRDDSLDSRSFGSIPIEGIAGKADFIYAPGQDWSRFGRIRQ